MYCIVQAISYLSFELSRYVICWRCDSCYSRMICKLSGPMCLHKLAVTGSVLGRALETSVTLVGRKFPTENYLMFKSL